jgi:hypothetical protein
MPTLIHSTDFTTAPNTSAVAAGQTLYDSWKDRLGLNWNISSGALQQVGSSHQRDGQLYRPATEGVASQTAIARFVYNSAVVQVAWPKFNALTYGGSGYGGYRVFKQVGTLTVDKSVNGGAGTGAATGTYTDPANGTELLYKISITPHTGGGDDIVAKLYVASAYDADPNSTPLCTVSNTMASDADLNGTYGIALSASNPQSFNLAAVYNDAVVNPDNGSIDFSTDDTNDSSVFFDITAATADPHNGSVTYRLHRGTVSTFTPSGATAVTSYAPQISGDQIADTTASPGVLYWYKLEAKDANGSYYSGSVYGGLKQTVVPSVALSSHRNNSILAYIGSSTWDPSFKGVPEEIDVLLEAQYGITVTTQNAAASSTRIADYMPGSTRYNNLMATLDGLTGYKVLRLMIGSNDAWQGYAVASWVADMVTLINAALSHVDIVVIEQIGIRTDGGNTTIEAINNYNLAAPTIPALTSAPSKVFAGTAYTLTNQALHPELWAGDNIHQSGPASDTSTGSYLLAVRQAAEMASLFKARLLTIRKRTAYQ